VDFNAPLLESPFALMKACCQLAETLMSFLLLQQLSEDFYYEILYSNHFKEILFEFFFVLLVNYLLTKLILRQVI